MKTLVIGVFAAAIAAPALSGEVIFGVTGMKGQVGGDSYDTDPYLAEGGHALIVPEDNKQTGYGAFVGYIWDVGKEGGFMLGLKGKYENLGDVDSTEYQLFYRIVDGDRQYLVTSEEASETLQSGSVLFTGEQNIGRYVKFYFSVGPAVTDGDPSAAQEVGFNFRMGPSPVWLSLAYHGYAWIREDDNPYTSNEYTTNYYRAAAASLNFRF